MKNAFLKRLEKQARFESAMAKHDSLADPHNKKVSRVQELRFVIETMENSDFDDVVIEKIRVEKNDLLAKAKEEAKPMNDAFKDKQTTLKEYTTSCTDYNTAVRLFIEETEKSFALD